MQDFGSNFGQMRNFVKCSLLPFLFTYFDLLSTKNSEQVLRTIKTSTFERMFNVYFAILGCLYGKWVLSLFRKTVSLQYAKFSND